MDENKTPEPEHPFCFITNPQKRGHFLVGYWDENDAFKVLHHASSLLSVEDLIEDLITDFFESAQTLKQWLRNKQL